MLGKLASGGAKIQTGSYTGTGTYGVSNPCSLTFDSVPKYIAIYTMGSDYNYTPIKVEMTPDIYGVANVNSIYMERYDDGTNNNIGKIVSWGNTVTFYANTSYYMPNKSGITYKYLAIG